MRKLFAPVVATVVVLCMALPALAATTAPLVEGRVNDERVARSIPSLTVKAFLENCAKQESDWMHDHDRLEHGHANSDCYTGTWGEIIGASDSPAHVVAAWLDSPDHRAIMLSRSYTKFGCAKAPGGGGTFDYYTCIFSA